jgi:hypothetical protein
MSKLEVLLFTVALLNLLVVLELVRRRKLIESYALLWIGIGLGGLTVALGRSVLDRISVAVGISYGANLILAAGLLVVLFINMSLTLHVSRLEARTEVLAEELALLRGARTPPEMATGDSLP